MSTQSRNVRFSPRNKSGSPITTGPSTRRGIARTVPERQFSGGGPVNSTHLLATLAYQLGMTSGNICQGAAVSLFMLPILATVIVFQLWYLRRQGVR